MLDDVWNPRPPPVDHVGRPRTRTVLATMRTMRAASATCAHDPLLAATVSAMICDWMGDDPDDGVLRRRLLCRGLCG